MDDYPQPVMTELIESAPEPEQPETRFATVGEVTADGVTLIFDGQEAATEKIYRVNADVDLQAGDRVRVCADSGTYVVEYAVGTPRERYPVPTPAAANKVLTSDGDGGWSWADAQDSLPSGGSNGDYLKLTVSGSGSSQTRSVSWAAVWPSNPSANQLLARNSSNNGMTWVNMPDSLPSGGSANQILAKNGTNTGYSWVDQPTGLPSGGSNGQWLQRTSSGYTWANSPIPSTGTTGYYLRKSSTGTEWAEVIPSTGTTGYVLTKQSSGYGWAAVPTELPAHGSAVTGFLKSTSGTLSWESSISVTQLYQSSTNNVSLDTSRALVPHAAGSSSYAYSLGSSSVPWYSLYVKGGTIKLGTASTAEITIGYAASSSVSKLGFWSATPVVRQTLSLTSQNMSYTSVTSSNYLTALNNLIGILKNKYGLIAT